MIPIPDNMPLLIGACKNQEETAVIEHILKGDKDLRQNLIDLGKFWKVRVWFKEPIHIQIKRTTKVTRLPDGIRQWTHRDSKITNDHVFSRITTGSTSNELIYATSRQARTGYFFPSLDLVTRYEPVIPSLAKDEFKSFEQFAAKFDLFFITQSEISRLWNGKSSQHGGRYKPSDFHRIGRRGKETLERFLRFFSLDATEKSPCYIESAYGGYYLNEKYKSMSTHEHFGRDISIEHRVGAEFVHYSSEYPGCGNGRYGLLANKNEFLWLEDD
jgi:hypothetical protein